MTIGAFILTIVIFGWIWNFANASAEKTKKKNFGKNIQLAREKLGMSQKELADKLSVSPMLIEKWEIGYLLPTSFKEEDEIAKALKTTANELHKP